MNGAMVPALLTVCLLGAAAANPLQATSGNSYWDERAHFLTEEEAAMIGGQLSFEGRERLANAVLMSAKHKELDKGMSNPNNFLPAQNFLKVGNQIEKTHLFTIISKMPKGAVLHAHDMAFVSFDFVYSNVTFRPNLYLCDTTERFELHFFDNPPSDCDWKLLSELREKDKTKQIDKRISEVLTMVINNPDNVYSNGNEAWKKFMNIFSFIQPLITYRPVYEDHFYNGLKELYEDNILYLELRSVLPPLYELNGTTYGPVEVARIYKEVTERFVQDYPDFIGMKLIYAPVRHVNIQGLDQYITTTQQIKAEMPEFLAGFDLVGHEDHGSPLKNFVEKLRPLGEEVQFFFHAGETNWYGASVDQNLIDAVLLNVKRIGHGYAAVKHPKVLELVKQKKIAIEVCPISNQVLHLTKDLRNHPGSILFSGDYPVVISNDDPGFWGAKGLTYDFYEAFLGMMSRSADIRALKQLALNSIEYSSLDEERKSRAFKIWKQNWDNFIDELSAFSTIPIRV